MIYPCHHCEDRKPGCHSNCEKYAEAQKVDAIRRETIKKENTAVTVLAKGFCIRESRMQRRLRREIKLAGK